ncbi:transferase [Streptomyces sp. NEAU-S7GS2]|uniref:transferase n=1 Tax=Streptomyces sp. NEAU-S7GS2 TaxID=2202000 RepID=UPI000D6FD353|nr:transferase [Streptomyces sp. NEAU-S7GS2]AWN24828.1 transferase [Streptomyces sp. NEAU-S7GS2]
MNRLMLGDYVSSPRRGEIAATPYRRLAEWDLAQYLAQRAELHRQALATVADRIHPSAVIHPTAQIGDDVLIGEGVVVHEFSSVRKGAVLCAGVRVGFNCEVTGAVLGEDAVLGHRIGVNSALVGKDAHLSANVTLAAISLSHDMRRPEREIVLRTPDGLYRCGTPAFAALIGDRVQTGNSISLGPGVVVGRGTSISSGVMLAARWLPAEHHVAAPHVTDAHVRPRLRPLTRQDVTL